MKNMLLTILIFGCARFGVAQDTTSKKFNDTLMLQNIEVTSIRASDKAPFTKTNLNRSEIEKNDLGYDLPFLLNQTPSVVAGSDAGNGVGYTNIRIRGTDAARINVTLNGIPFNDAESQGTFFVDMPDIASSLNSIQIQRGVGTSSNGAGAFGATVNLSTNEVNKEKYLQTENTFGSFNTWKNNLKIGTGIFKNHFTFDARISSIVSDGYIDRASSNLKSYYASAAYLGKKTSVRFNFISGKEKTYQAWNGVPEILLKTDRTYNSAGTDKPGAPYDNETDNYVQSHYQLFLNQKVNDAISFNVAAFLIRGKGYYENYKGSQKFKKYGLPDLINGADTITKTDLILQQWLDNYFYGSVYSLQYHKRKTDVTIGGGYSKYDGGHYNIVTWAQQGFPENYKYYNAPAHKQDVNFYVKWMQSLGKGFTAFADIQQRLINYQINGFKDHPDIDISKKYAFTNPKVGLSFNKNNYQAYLSFSVAAKEPNRDDFEAGIEQLPTPEHLYDWELGIKRNEKTFSYGATFYYMDYKNQLVNTGKINDVGAYTRTNAPKSYRAGVEMEGAWQIEKWFSAAGNIAFSKNKIKDFTEYVNDYDDGTQKSNHFTNTDIAFSPDVVAAANLDFIPFKNAMITLQSKYVGEQFLDNTSNPNRMIDPYFLQDARVTYIFSKGIFKEVKLFFQVNNVFNKLYSPNGYTFNYISDGKLEVENYYFPMAGTNFMTGLTIRL